MSSAKTKNSAESIVSTTPDDVVGQSNAKGSLNPNAAVFDCLSHMTLSDGTDGSVVALVTPPVTPPDQWPETAPSNELHNMQYSPNAAMNGYGPYSNPVTPEVMPVPSELSPDKLPIEELKVLLRHQLEFYFSRENLASDTYLVSQMDGDQYVPIWTVANFNQVKKLTKDLDLVKNVMRESPNLQVDESGEKVRPNVKRCIVVLREIPESTPVEDVQALFSGENCPSCTRIDFAHNNYWYVQFDSEEDAQKAYRFLREEVKTFRGKPIMARIKAKPIHQSNNYNMPKNGLRQQQVTEPPATYNQQHFQFPPPAVFNGQQALPFYPPAANMLATWPPAQPLFQDPNMPSAYPDGFTHGPLNLVAPANTGRHNFPGNNRPRFQNNHPKHHRDQQNDRIDRDMQRNRSQNSPVNNSSNGGAVNNINNRAAGFSRQRDTRDDDYARRNARSRRRRGSSEDVSKHLRQKEGKASPVRHSKDDSDTIDLAPSHFPPLPTSPLALFKTQGSKEFPDAKEPSSPQDKKVNPVPNSFDHRVNTEVKQKEPPSPVKVENKKVPETKPIPQSTEDVAQSTTVLSYAQVTQKTPTKQTAVSLANSNNNQSKSPTK